MDDAENFFTGLCFDPLGGGSSVTTAGAATAASSGFGVPRSPGTLNTPVSVSADANFSFKPELLGVEPVPITGTLIALLYY